MTAPDKRPEKTVSTARAGFAATNREAARIILADPERYAGMLVEWARMVMSLYGKSK